jgi:hypothetical protein
MYKHLNDIKLKKYFFILLDMHVGRGVTLPLPVPSPEKVDEPLKRSQFCD